MTVIGNSFQPTITPTGLLHFCLSLKSSAPCLALKDVVHSYLQIKVDRPALYPVIPDGTQSIYMSANGTMVGGAQQQAHDMKLWEAGEYFGVRFYSGALRHFFKLDLSEITDQLVDCHYFPRKDFSSLHEVIYQNSDYAKRVTTCEKWLLQNYTPQTNIRFERALHLVYQSYGTMRVTELADKLNWGSRHLNRLFRLHTGLSTKTFSKIIRIQQACKQLYINPRQSLGDSKVDLGYFDQSHLIKNFRQHLGSKPTTFANNFMSGFYNQ